MSSLPARTPALLERARSLLQLPGGPADRLSPAELDLAATAVRTLHQGLVGTRALARPSTYDERAHLGAYLLWWWPQTYAKVRAALRLTFTPMVSASSKHVRVLDLGSGPGPGALALVDALAAPGRRVEALCVDASARALSEAAALAEGGLRTRLGNLAAGSALPGGTAHRSGDEGPFDLVLLANALSELPGDVASKARLLEALVEENLAPGGALIVLEPALRETGRALLEVRDRVLAAGGLRALAPCFTQRPCPALEHPRDWCTVEQPWDAPPHVVQLARALGLHADASLSFAPLVLSRSVPAPDPDVVRVVGVPPEEKGKRRLFVCNDRGRLPVARLHAQASGSNAAFDALGRGDIARLAGLASKGDGLRVERDSQVERLEQREGGRG